MGGCGGCGSLSCCAGYVAGFWFVGCYVEGGCGAYGYFEGVVVVVVGDDVVVVVVWGRYL